MTSLLLFAFAVPIVELRTSLYASSYGAIRSALDRGETPGVVSLATGVETLKKLEARFPDHIRTRAGAEIKDDPVRAKSLYWRTLDAYVYSANSVSDLREFSESAPDMIGGYLPSKDAIALLVQALEPVVASKAVESDGPFQAVNVRLAFWKEQVAPKLTPILERAMTTLGADTPPARLQVLVLPAAGGREGMTVRAPGGSRIVIGAGKYEGHDFSEVVIHEVLHALDTSAAEKGFLAELRTALKAAGRSTEDQERLPHAAIFALAAQLTREGLDAKHVDVGERHGAYSRGLESAYRTVVGPVTDLLSRKIDRNAAIAAIVNSPL